MFFLNANDSRQKIRKVKRLKMLFFRKVVSVSCLEKCHGNRYRDRNVQNILVRCYKTFRVNYRPQRSCGQGNIFTSVCLSTAGSVCLSTCWDTTPPRADTPWEQTPPRSRHPPGLSTPPAAPPPGSRLRHTVNERPVRILLECILVTLQFSHNSFELLPIFLR